MEFQAFNLDPAINKAIQICKYKEPTPIQARTIPFIMQGKDVVASAPTGTGKTAAFMMPALHHIANKQKKSKLPQILILTPTRELANQITKAAATYGKFLRFNIANLVGGMPYHHQIKDLQRGCEIIVATPGRLIDHIERERVDLSQIDMLILDEADRMLDMGFIEDIEYITKLTPKHRQTLLFSATIDKTLKNIINKLLKDPEHVSLSGEKISAPKIQQTLYKAHNLQHKARLLKHFLNDANIYKAIIFSATKINADKLADQLCDQGFAAAALHGDLRQNVRNRTIEKLRRGKIQILVATDVAARGIDIVDVTHVINYDLPRFCEDYVHRIGRTGRAGKSGIAISFVLPSDTVHVRRIERFIGQRLPFQDIVLDGEESFAREKPARKENFKADRYKTDRAERTYRTDRATRTARADRSERTDRPVRADRSERTDRPVRSARSERTDKTDRSERFHESRKPKASHERKFKTEYAGKRNKSKFARNENKIKQSAPANETKIHHERRAKPDSHFKFKPKKRRRG